MVDLDEKKCSLCGKLKSIDEFVNPGIPVADDWASHHLLTIDEVRVGDVVKVGAEVAHEYFYAHVTEIKGEDITARVMNHLLVPFDYDYGSLIQFEAMHILT